jgi:DNA-binding response OmpR family regulator
VAEANRYKLRMRGATILVVDDDPALVDAVKMLLERAGHRVIRASDGHEALEKAYLRSPDLIVLDVEMPKLDGWQVLKRLREVTEAPVLMLTVDDAEASKVRGLQRGADDYVTKPFGRQELLARVGALLRRAGTGREVPAVTRLGPLEVRDGEGVTRIDGEELPLTPLEFKLLSIFARNPGQVLSADQIVELVWQNPHSSPKQVKLLVARLRKKLNGKLEVDPIETVRGFGYRFNPPDG